MPLEPPPPPPSSAPLPPPPPSPYGGEATAAYAPAPQPAAKRSKATKIGLGAGIVALVAVAGSLTVAMSGSGAGAGSPDEAVEQFADAVSDEDVVGAITMLPPSEVGSAHELYEPLVQLLIKNDALEGDNPLAGVDIEITDLELESQELADGVGKVYIRGGKATLDVTASEVDPALADGVTDTHEEIDLAEAQELIDQGNAELGSMSEDFGGPTIGGQISGPFLMTIEEGGRWYVSPSYTLAEYAREALGLPEPDFGAWRDQVGPGASSPSEVIESFAAAASALDSDVLADAIESGGGNPIPELEVKGALAPGEFAALFDYMPSFQQWAEEQVGADPTLDQQEMLAEIADALRGVDFDVTVDVDTREDRIADDRVKVVVSDATIEVHASGEFEGEQLQLDLVIQIRDGLCAEASGTATFDGETETFDESGCAGDVLPGANFDGVFLVTVERDGGWYFSPTETLVEYARVVIDSELAK